MGVLNHDLQPYGMFFAPDPSSENYCSLGGMIGNNASGARSVAYGGYQRPRAGAGRGDGRRLHLRSRGQLPLDSPELASLLAGRLTGGRAFAAVLPELAGRPGA